MNQSISDIQLYNSTKITRAVKKIWGDSFLDSGFVSIQ